MKLISLLFVGLLLIGCTKDPESASLSSNPNVVVEKLFEHEGCTVYRFRDGNYHYYTKCANSSTTISQLRQSCGKNCWKTVDYNNPTTYE